MIFIILVFLFPLLTFIEEKMLSAVTQKHFFEDSGIHLVVRRNDIFLIPSLS